MMCLDKERKQAEDGEITSVDGATLKMLVDRILVRNEGIEVQFSCGVSIEKAYVR